MYDIRKVLVDKGSSISLITLEAFNKLGLDKNNFVKVSYSLVGLGDKIIAALGTINLPLVLGDQKHKSGGRHSIHLQCNTQSFNLKLPRDSY